MKGEIQPENFKFLQPSVESSRLGLRNSAQFGSVYLFTTLYYQKSNRTMRPWGQVTIFNSMKIVLIEMTSESGLSKGAFIDHAYSSVEIRMQFESMHFAFFFFNCIYIEHQVFITFSIYVYHAYFWA